MSTDTYSVAFNAGDTIFHEGSRGDVFFIVMRGAVEIRKGGKVLSRLGPGEFFGEMAVIESAPRAADAIAAEDRTEVMPVDRARFLYLVSQQPGFAVMIMETLSRWLRGGQPEPATATATDRLSRGKPASETYAVVEAGDGVFQLRSRTRSCNTYLFKGRRRNVLVDTGLVSGFDSLAACLGSLGLEPNDIDLIALTHEHFDHVAAVSCFQDKPFVAAHKLAAHKLANRDEFGIIKGSFSETSEPFDVDMVLDEGALIDTGSHRLRVYHTPGHTSGCISLFDGESGLLVSGDMVMAGGPMGGIFGSGSLSDSIFSLELLAGLGAKRLLPGHGALSDDPTADIAKTLERSRALLSESHRIFQALNAQESINKIVLAVRDLNR